MLILISSDIQYLEKVVFSFEGGSNQKVKITTPQVSPPNKKNYPPVKSLIPSKPLILFRKGKRKGETPCLCKTVCAINF